jgi:hypothetical protein
MSPSLVRLFAAGVAWRLRRIAAARRAREGFVRRIDGTRAVQITPKGQRAYREKFGVRFD